MMSSKKSVRTPSSTFFTLKNPNTSSPGRIEVLKHIGGILTLLAVDRPAQVAPALAVSIPLEVPPHLRFQLHCLEVGIAG